MLFFLEGLEVSVRKADFLPIVGRGLLVNDNLIPLSESLFSDILANNWQEKIQQSIHFFEDLESEGLKLQRDKTVSQT